MDMTFRSAARRLDDLDLPKLGAMIGVGERFHFAVVEFLQAGEGDDAPTFAVERSQ